MTAEVVIYGASGYTGKLIAWHMAEFGIPFIAAGRSQQRLEEQMAKVPELEGHDYECVAVDNDRAALAELFQGKKVVYNVVGPFMQLGGPVVEACLDAGCHYLDSTGEQDWMFHVKRTWGKQFEEKNLVLIPACSWMWVGGVLAAELALEHPGVDTLDLLYLRCLDHVLHAYAGQRPVHAPQQRVGDLAQGHGLPGTGARPAHGAARAALGRGR